ncbi:hypothetical protein [Actinomadura sp. 6K520]|uniref:hypothetical protein n=1 Tax=Actinomadura sp. 6K520 TaxID=2530364 RepID=UPI0010473EB1|nr:hypothetical protein [Actinomadura sp. 6K520]TDE26449.1 hypothetical protein E1289_25590 [Actinomadura sp. 6K520]
MRDRVRSPRPRPRPRPRFIAVPSRPSGPSSPSSSGPSRSPGVSSWAVWPVGVEWDESRSLHIGRCQRCADSFASSRPGEVDDWTDTHRCDPDLAALLALADTRRAA